MTSPKIYSFIINSIDVTSYVHQSVIPSNKQPVKNGMIRLIKRIDSVLTIDDSIVSKSVYIGRGETSGTERCILRGEVLSYKIVGSFYELTVVNKLYGCVKREVDYTFERNIDVEEGIGSEIVKNILTVGNVPYSDDSIPSTGTDELLRLKIYPAKGKGLNSIKELADMYKRRIYYNDDEDLAYFTPFDGIETGKTLTTGTDIVGRIAWNNTSEDMNNNITVIGGEQLDWNTETFTPSSGQTTFTLAAKPVDTEVYVNSVLKSRGVNSSAPNDFYVIEDKKQIIFTVSPYPHTTVINYSYNIPVKASNFDDDSIDEYTQRDNTVINSKLSNTDDAELYVTNVLETQKDLVTNAPIKVINNNDLEIGEIITINDTITGITRKVYIESIEYSYPFKPDMVSIGKTPVNEIDLQLSVLHNIYKLQRQLSTNSDVNLQLINKSVTVEVSGYTKLGRVEKLDNDAYWDYDNWDDDTAFWCDDSEELFIDDTMIPFNNTVFEDFRSEEFKDASTTANWSNTGVCAFDNGEIALSKTYLISDDDVTAVTVECDDSTNLSFRVSTNGTDYEDVTIDTEHVMEDTGGYLYIEITASGSASLKWFKIIYR